MLVVLVAALASLAVAAPPAAAAPRAAGAAPQAVPPQDDAFYTPPDPIPDVPAGTVLRSRPVSVTAYGLPVPVRAWQVLYRSTSATGEPNAVSGTVLVPDTPWPGTGTRPLVSYAVGTHGLGPECAPSYKLARGTEQELPLIGQALRRGWAVAVTDYEGLGTPGPHTYVAGPSLGHAMLDAARAAQHLPGSGLSPSSPVGLWGYSEGGFASGWAAQLEASYAPELDIRGAAVGAPPTDPESLAEVHDGGPFSGLVIAAALGLATAYPDAPFEEILTAEGRRAMAALATMCVEEFSTRFALRTVGSYTTVDDPMALPRWQDVLDAVRLGGTAPSSPTMIYHSPTDELVLFDQGVQLHSAWCRGGATVRFQPAVAGEHVLGAVTGAPLAVDYLAGRFAGRPAPDTCRVTG
ncbi:hypothetical protein BAY60_15815 [Prauserella muralis]|uniref:Secretory lipase n=2 Tax=Prauserella muralis TaxID=588067 RepID=A0A2V4BFR1_9PSEU|nr:hypothetical protein BAY60_15815 [Prauserella muralis]